VRQLIKLLIKGVDVLATLLDCVIFLLNISLVPINRRILLVKLLFYMLQILLELRIACLLIQHF